MTAFNRDLQPIVRGDTKQIERTFINLPTGIIVDRAWLTVKTSPNTQDPGLFQITITSTPSSAGRISDANTTDGQISMYFNVNGTQSLAATAGVRYLYDIQVRDGSTSEIYTLVMGTVTFVDQVTITA